MLYLYMRIFILSWPVLIILGMPNVSDGVGVLIVTIIAFLNFPSLE